MDYGTRQDSCKVTLNSDVYTGGFATRAVPLLTLLP